MNDGSEFKFLDLSDVLLLHELQIERYGGASGIRDQGFNPLLTATKERRGLRLWYF